MKLTREQLDAIARKPGYRIAGQPGAAPVTPKAANKASKLELEELFAFQLKSAGIRTPVRQYSPFLDRAFRLDFAWPVIPSDPHLDWSPGIAFEVQGMAHRIKQQFKDDCRRHCALVLAGWTMYYVSGDMVRDGSAVHIAKQALLPALWRSR